MALWVTITVDDLLDTKVAKLVEALQTVALGVGQDDPTDEIIADVIARIRAEIAACKSNVLDADESKIPFSLKSIGCRMVIREMQSRLQEPLTEDERQEKKDDLEYLKRISQCDVPVDQPNDPGESGVQRAGGIEVVTSSPILTTRDQLKGL